MQSTQQSFKSVTHSKILTYNEGAKQYVVMVEDVITYFINYLFTGYEVLNTFTFRITRNADLTIHEDG